MSMLFFVDDVAVRTKTRRYSVFSRSFLQPVNQHCFLFLSAQQPIVLHATHEWRTPVRGDKLRSSFNSRYVIMQQLQGPLPREA